MKAVPLLAIFVITTIHSINCTAQNDTLRKYSNGNYLFKIQDGFELRSSNHQTIAQWNVVVETFNLKEDRIQRIRKKEKERLSEGIFNLSKGIILLEPKYEVVGRLNLPAEFVFAKQETGYALVSLPTLKTTSFSYKFACTHPNPVWLMAFSDTKTHIYNKQLELIDSIPGVIGQNGLLFNGKEVFMIARTAQGVSLLDSQNHLLSENGWIKIRSMEGNRIAVATKDGFGIYDINKRIVIAPYLYDDFQAEYGGTHFLLAKGKQYKLIDSAGTTIFETSADGMIPGFRWEAFFFAKEALWGLLNKKGEIIQKPIWNNFENTYRETFTASAPNQAATNYTYQYKEVNSVKTLVSLASSPVGTPPPAPFDSSLPPIEQAPPPSKASGDDEENKVFAKMEINPVFTKEGVTPQEYLSNAIKTYRLKHNIRIKGTVRVYLVIEKDGSISKTDILQSSDPRLDAPSLQIIRQMKPWTPGQQNGRVVRGGTLLELKW